MAAARASIQLARSIKRLTKLRAVIAEHVANVLSLRIETCDETSVCRGWFIDPERGIERCDECAHLNGYADVLDDDLFAYLPEAQAALKAFDR